MFELILITVGMVFGFVLGFILAKLTAKKVSRVALAPGGKEALVERAKLEERLNVLEEEHEKLGAEKQRLYDDCIELTNKVGSFQTEKNLLMEKLQSQKKEAQELHRELLQQFENLSSKIVNEQREKFAKQNVESLSSILDPFKNQLKKFHKKVEETHDKDEKERISLKTQIENLNQINQHLGQEAKNLSVALKGDSKASGRWGEFILENVLQKAGLREGEEYSLQGKGSDVKNEEGGTEGPDIAIKLPDGKHLIIDSKVSLAAYEKAMNTEVELDRKRHEKEHAQSILTHMNALAEKDFQKRSDCHSVDFVLMFIPIESALSLAYQTEKDLFQKAWEKRVVIVSPTTLFATMQTVASLWKIEQQNKNSQKIAEQGGKLYDKFVDFVADLEAVGKNLGLAKQSYEGAFHKLSLGRDTLVDCAEKMRELGIHNKKDLSEGSPVDDLSVAAELETSDEATKEEASDKAEAPESEKAKVEASEEAQKGSGEQAQEEDSDGKSDDEALTPLAAGDE